MLVKATEFLEDKGKYGQLKRAGKKYVSFAPFSVGS